MSGGTLLMERSCTIEELQFRQLEEQVWLLMWLVLEPKRLQYLVQVSKISKFIILAFCIICMYKIEEICAYLFCLSYYLVRWKIQFFCVSSDSHCQNYKSAKNILFEGSFYFSCLIHFGIMKVRYILCNMKRAQGERASIYIQGSYTIQCLRLKDFVREMKLFLN